MGKCPLCEKDSQLNGIGPMDMIFQVTCKTCGLYLITDGAIKALLSEDIKNKRINISAFIKEQTIKELPPVTLIDKDNDQIKNLPKITLYDAIKRFPEKFSDRVDKALINLSKLSKNTGSEITILPESDYPILYVDSDSLESIIFMVNHLSDTGLINKDRSTHDGFSLKLTPRGWNRIYELERTGNKNSNQAFVAMWFDNSMGGAWENGFKKGIEDTGFTAIRIDNVEHNNKICDEIIGEIRKSKFIVCDFTGQRGGVYFEAGFGLGLGIQVIWTCKEEDVGKLHFDTRQYSHILWKDEEDLRVKLKNKILATIP